MEIRVEIIPSDKELTDESKNNNSNNDIVNIGVTDTLSSVNPLLQDGTEVVKYTTSLAFLPLVELNKDLEFVGQLAKEITTEDNGLLLFIWMKMRFGPMDKL